MNSLPNLVDHHVDKFILFFFINHLNFDFLLLLLFHRHFSMKSNKNYSLSLWEWRHYSATSGIEDTINNPTEYSLRKIIINTLLSNEQFSWFGSRVSISINLFEKFRSFALMDSSQYKIDTTDKKHLNFSKKNFERISFE